MDGYRTVMYVLHGYWNSSDTDGVIVPLVTKSKKEAVDMLRKIAENQASDFAPAMKDLEIKEQSDRLYEAWNDDGDYVKFYIESSSVFLESEFLEKMYRLRQKQYRLEDIKSAINDAYEWEQITKKQHEEATNSKKILQRIADKFDETEDCNVDYNSAMNNAVMAVIKSLEKKE